MKQLEVTILGQSYRLACSDEGEAALHAAVRAVDREMSAIHDAGKIKAREKIAVLAALNLASQKVEAQRESAAAPVAAPATAPDEARIAALIARIDSALGADGHLL